MPKPLSTAVQRATSSTRARGHPREALFTLAVTSGMRQDELLGLRWRDVDWAARRISVHHTLVRMHGRWWLGDPKTAKSERAVVLTDPTIDLLRTPRAHQAERLLAIGHRVTDDDFVFSDDAGEPLWGRHVTTREFQPLLRSAERLDAEPTDRPPARSDRDKGAEGGRRPTKRPDLNSDRAENASLVPHTGFRVKRLMCLSRVHPVHSSADRGTLVG